MMFVLLCESGVQHVFDSFALSNPAYHSWGLCAPKSDSFIGSPHSVNKYTIQWFEIYRIVQLL